MKQWFVTKCDVPWLPKGEEGFVGHKRVRHPTMLLHSLRTTIQLLGSHNVMHVFLVGLLVLDPSCIMFMWVPLLFTMVLLFECFTGQQLSFACPWPFLYHVYILTDSLYYSFRILYPMTRWLFPVFLLLTPWLPSTWHLVQVDSIFVVSIKIK
jgi:hypothetical protein